MRAKPESSSCCRWFGCWGGGRSPWACRVLRLKPCSKVVASAGQSCEDDNQSANGGDPEKYFKGLIGSECNWLSHKTACLVLVFKFSDFNFLSRRLATAQSKEGPRFRTGAEHVVGH